MMYEKTCLHLLLVLLSSVVVSGEQQLKLLLHSYRNPSHQLYTGLCCDSPSSTKCELDPCDTALTLCLLPRHGGELPDSSPGYLREGLYRRFKCPHQWRGVDLGGVADNSDDIVFPGGDERISQKGFRNPITFKGDSWEDGFKLLVLAVDLDIHGKELVGVLTGEWDHLPSNNKFSRPLTLTNKGRGNVTLSISAWVDRDGGEEKTLNTDELSRSQSEETTPLTITRSQSEETTPLTITRSQSGETTPLTITWSQSGETTPLTITRSQSEETTPLTITQSPPTQTFGPPTTLPPSQTTPTDMDTTVASPTSEESVFKDSVKGIFPQPVNKRTVAAGVGGVFGVALVLVVAVLVTVLCASCVKNRRREDQLRLTGNADSEVTALRTGPSDNPNYTGVLPNSHTSSDHQPSYGFSNSLYGALSQDCRSKSTTSHDSHMTSSPSHPPVHSQYSVVTREHMEGEGLEDSGSYAQVRGEGPVPAGYSVITRENMGDEGEGGYTVITRDNMADDGYSLVTRENLQEASDSGSETEQDGSHDLVTSKLLSGEHK